MKYFKEDKSLPQENGLQRTWIIFLSLFLLVPLKKELLLDENRLSIFSRMESKMVLTIENVGFFFFTLFYS